MREIEVEGLSRYQCRVGHAYTAESLLHGQDEALERALWSAIRTFEERITVLTNLAESSKNFGRSSLEQRYRRRAMESRRHALELRKFLLAVNSYVSTTEVTDGVGAQ